MAELDLAELRAAHPDEDTLVGALAAEVTRLRAAEVTRLRSAAPAVDRAGILAVLNRYFAKDGMPAYVKAWFPNEIEFYREGDWDSFTDRNHAIWQLRLDRAVDALLDQVAGTPAGDAGTLRSELRKAARTLADWRPEQTPLLSRTADELTRLRKQGARSSNVTRALAAELQAAAVTATAWEPHQVPLLARAAVELARLSVPTTGTVTLVFSDAEVLHLGSDLSQDTRAKIGPRLSAALKVVTAAHKLLDDAGMGAE